MMPPRNKRCTREAPSDGPFAARWSQSQTERVVLRARPFRST